MTKPFEELKFWKDIGSTNCESCGSKLMICERDSEAGKVQYISACKPCTDALVSKEANEYYQAGKIRRIESVFERFSFITEDLISASFDSYQPDKIFPSQAEAKNKSIWFAENFRSIKANEHSWCRLLFQGEYGLGKSHLCKSMCDAIRKQGFMVLFINVPMFFRAIKSTYNNNSKVSEVQMLKMIEEADFVVFDEIGAEYIKKDSGEESWGIELNLELHNIRLGKPTAFNTNYQSADLKSKYGVHGGRIVSRMMQGTKVVKVDGKDHRMKQF